MTPEERKEYNKKYREANKDKFKEYYEANKDKFKEYYEANKENIKEKIKNYYKINKGGVKEKKKEYYENNKQARLEYQRKYKINRKLSDPLFKLTCNIRNAIRKSFINNGYKKTSKTFLILGCSFEEFKQHLESKFETWMTWDNYGLYNGTANYGWDIDHIIPSSTALTEEDVIKLNHYTKLQPMCSYYNRDVKKNKIG